MKPSRVLRASSLALLGLALPLAASQPANSERLSTPLSSPQEALKALQLPKGFVATLFASEPQIQNPIALSWDQRGRLWIAENYTYAEAGKRIEDAYSDRIRIAEDTDWDGQAETITTYAEGLKVLTSIAVVDEGVYALCPPQLLYLPDRNHDDRPDGPAQVLLDGFEIAQSNHHNFANGLRMGADGWLYGRCGHSCPAWIGEPGSPQSQRLPMQGGIWRYHPLRRTIEVLAHGTTNPWGHDWDGNGEMFFVNSVTGHLWHLVEGIHLRDSNPSKHPWVYERLDQIADHHHFDTRAAWHESRDGRANALGGKDRSDIARPRENSGESQIPGAVRDIVIEDLVTALERARNREAGVRSRCALIDHCCHRHRLRGGAGLEDVTECAVAEITGA